MGLASPPPQAKPAEPPPQSSLRSSSRWLASPPPEASLSEPPPQSSLRSSSRRLASPPPQAGLPEPPPHKKETTQVLDATESCVGRPGRTVSLLTSRRQVVPSWAARPGELGTALLLQTRPPGLPMSSSTRGSSERASWRLRGNPSAEDERCRRHGRLLARLDHYGRAFLFAGCHMKEL